MKKRREKHPSPFTTVEVGPTASIARQLDGIGYDGVEPIDMESLLDPDDAWDIAEGTLRRSYE